MRALGVTVLVVSALTAGPAAAASPATVVPSVALEDAAVAGTALKTRLDVAFAVPARAATAKACAGRVRATVKLSRRTRRTFTGSLAGTAGRCHAVLRGSLPKGLLGRTAAFRITFAGNTAIRPFARTVTLKLVPPAPAPAPAPQPTSAPPQPAPAPTPPSTPPGPPATSFFDPAYKGTWGTDPPTSGVNDQWVITINGSGVVGVSSFGTFRWLCGSGDVLTDANWNLVYQDTGAFSAPDHAEDTAARVSGTTSTSVHWTLDFDGPALGTGHGTMSVSGQYDYGPSDVRTCHMTAAFTFYRSGT